MASSADSPGRPGRLLKDRRALVTGGSRNLGAIIAVSLARSGADVAIGYRKEAAEAARVVERIRAEGVAGHAVAGDLAESDQVRQVVERAGESLGGAIQILINNAGPFAGDPFSSLAEADWDRIMDVNLKAAYLCAQFVAPGMRRAGWGRIVNLSAGSAYILDHSVYGLAKSALMQLTEALALELGPEITVNAVAPGQIEESAPEVSQIDPTFVARAIERSPGGRLVTRSEVAEVVTWLCSPAADMITGHTIPLDAGWRFNRS